MFPRTRRLGKTLSRRNARREACGLARRTVPAKFAPNDARQIALHSSQKFDQRRVEPGNILGHGGGARKGRGPGL
jgi:hypothetical protein